MRAGDASGQQYCCRRKHIDDDLCFVIKGDDEGPQTLEDSGAVFLKLGWKRQSTRDPLSLLRLHPHPNSHYWESFRRGWQLADSADGGS
jgi:hypothetical protein